MKGSHGRGAALAILLLFLLAGQAHAELDQTETSDTIAGRLKPTPGYPLIGFWKDHCEDAFGLAIDRAGDGLYSISFCGPGGCFAPGTYRPNSPIVGDPNYRVIDHGTLELTTRDGFARYFRCGETRSQPST